MPVWTFKCRFCLLSAGFGASSAGFAGKKDGKNEEKKIKISRKASPSCALNNTNAYAIYIRVAINDYITWVQNRTFSRALSLQALKPDSWHISLFLEKCRPVLPSLGIPLTIQRGNSARMSKILKKVSKWVPGASRPRGPKKSEKSSKRVKKSRKSQFLTRFELFSDFFGPRGREAPATHFETFFGLFHIRAELLL